MMPRMSGYEVLRRIRERANASTLPVVFLTAKNQIGDLVQGLLSGANDYLTKPFSKEELVARARTQLSISQTSRAYARFVPHEFLRLLNKESIVDVRLGDSIKLDMTVLFSDIRSFATISEGMNPEDSFAFLNSHWAGLGPVVRGHGGFIDKFIGDGVMALFGGTPDAGISAAIDIQRAVRQQNLGRTEQVRVGVGVHTGSLMLGTVGDEMRMEGTVISDAVNLASRIESLSKLYGASVIVSGEIRSRLVNLSAFRMRLLDRVRVMGRREPVEIFEVLDALEEREQQAKLAGSERFAEGLWQYFRGDFPEASAVFADMAGLDPADRALLVYAERSAAYAATRPTSRDGYANLVEK